MVFCINSCVAKYVTLDILTHLAFIANRHTYNELYRATNSQFVSARAMTSIFDAKMTSVTATDMCNVISSIYLSRLMGKPTICIGENKDVDQLRGNREADQRLCFRYSDSTIPLLHKSEISRI